MFFRVAAILTLYVIINGCSVSKKSTEKKSNVTSSFEKKFGCPIPVNSNEKFLNEVSEWLGTPYKYGGTNKNGVDCSGFVQAVYKIVFNKIVEHNSFEIYKKAKKLNELKVQQGDLVFFKISKNRVDHIGMVIYQNYFVHASTKKGVIVNDVNQTYYKEKFVSYGVIN
jgi:cell wall-associated NlpC family hydrolase